LCFITATIVDKNGIVLPNANHLIEFKTTTNALVKATDNGSPIDLIPFKTKRRNAFNGLCLAIIKAKSKTGTIRVEAVSKGLEAGIIELQIQ
jgi:beta-galactosidase